MPTMMAPLLWSKCRISCAALAGWFDSSRLAFANTEGGARVQVDRLAEQAGNRERLVACMVKLEVRS
jgi:hypothetical protein